MTDNGYMEGHEQHLSLLELNSLVRGVISAAMPGFYWVEAELSEAREGYGGHCYMELIEKEPQSNTPVAKAHASCWRNRWMYIKPRFERITGQALHSGMKVLLKVRAQFHENYGFSWIVDDIDPNYTMGDMMRKRMEIVRALKEQGVFDLQKELALPMFCQRIAVVSSASAAGYGDFCNQLADNPCGLVFRTGLFPATMQGEGVERSVIDALDSIYADCDNWDCVVIIRGGGATSDLSGFDTLALAENVANFPLPVITGIGHDRDESVLDMVSHLRVKTPTAAAAFLVQHLSAVLDRITEAQDCIINNVKRRLQLERMKIDRLSSAVPAQCSLVAAKQRARTDRLAASLVAAVRTTILSADARLDRLAQTLRPAAERKILTENHRLQMMSQRLAAQDPELLLKRGYSITLKDGKSIRRATDLKKGDVIETRFADGTAMSRVE